MLAQVETANAVLEIQIQQIFSHSMQFVVSVKTSELQQVKAPPALWWPTLFHNTEQGFDYFRILSEFKSEIVSRCPY